MGSVRYFRTHEGRAQQRVRPSVFSQVVGYEGGEGRCSWAPWRTDNRVKVQTPCAVSLAPRWPARLSAGAGTPHDARARLSGTGNPWSLVQQPPQACALSVGDSPAAQPHHTRQHCSLLITKKGGGCAAPCAVLGRLTAARRRSAREPVPSPNPPPWSRRSAVAPASGSVRFHSPAEPRMNAGRFAGSKSSTAQPNTRRKSASAE